MFNKLLADFSIEHCVKFYTLGAAVLWLTGCAMPYVPPIGATATLKIAGDHTLLLISNDGSCRRSRVSREQTEVPIASGKRLWITQSWFGGYQSCGAEISFEPEAGAEYFTEFRRSDRQCNMRIYRITSDGHRAVEPSARLGRYSGC